MGGENTRRCTIAVPEGPLRQERPGQENAGAPLYLCSSFRNTPDQPAGYGTKNNNQQDCDTTFA
jgi:hypothetical protein